MSEYLNPQAFLADARLRSEAFEVRQLGILVVEGPDDRRLFARHVITRAQVLPAGGRGKLLEVFNLTTAADRRRMVFVTDCDYEVRRGTLRPTNGLVITESTDMECDLVHLGVLRQVVGEVVPEVGGSDENIDDATQRTLNDAIAFALPLGRIRMAAQPLGVDLKLESIKFRNHVDKLSQKVDVDKLARTAHQRIAKEHGISFSDWITLLDATPNDEGMCHGKDLIRAIVFSLNSRYSVASDVTEVSVSRLLRTSLWTNDFNRWTVARRIRSWEQSMSRQVLTPGHN